MVRGRALRFRVAMSALWLASQGLGCGTPEPPPHVVLVVIDTLRADHLNSYGYDLPTSRKLERLAARGLMFRSAYASGSSTATSIPTLLASRFPSELSGRLAADGPAELTLSEAFQRAGYQTVGYQANFALLAELGYSRGFDDYHVLKVRREGSWRYRRAAEIHDECRRFLERRDARPFFLYVQTMDVHVPHDPHPRFKDRVHPAKPRSGAVPAGIDLDPTALATFALFMDALDRKAYDEEVAYATHEFVRFYGMLRRFDLLEDTLVVLTADHGEPLGEHGHAMHGLALYEEQVHVPLMLWMPGYPPGERAGIVSLLDLAPTILDLAGLPIPSSFRGQSWAGSPSQIALGERVKTTSRVPVGAFVRHGPWKLITGPQGQELYDLRIDPDEATNVRDAYPILTEYLIQELIAHIPYHRGLGRKPVRFDAGLSPRAQRELHESLRALGYLE